jgi:hypothetical protein
VRKKRITYTSMRKTLCEAIEGFSFVEQERSPPPSSRF